MFHDANFSSNIKITNTTKDSYPKISLQYFFNSRILSFAVFQTISKLMVSYPCTILFLIPIICFHGILLYSFKNSTDNPLASSPIWNKLKHTTSLVSSFKENSVSLIFYTLSITRLHLLVICNNIPLSLTPNII